uniref:Uncharacterized protein n=1 Tax=Pristionchus pacificus TaxID=54126 RepID=A0A8R1V6P2_PRIPA
MRLTEALNQRETRLLVALLLVFNAIPLIGGSIVFITTFVINFGVALIVQLTATVITLAFVLPTVLVCSTTAAALFLLIRIVSEYVDLFADRDTPPAMTTVLETTVPQAALLPYPVIPRPHLNVKLD